MICALSCLAEWPSRIHKIFLTKEINYYGVYGIKICDMGEWTDVIIDDNFPCSND